MIVTKQSNPPSKATAAAADELFLMRARMSA
jgi:hypothetical protein